MGCYIESHRGKEEVVRRNKLEMRRNMVFSMKNGAHAMQVCNDMIPNSNETSNELRIKICGLSFDLHWLVV